MQRWEEAEGKGYSIWYAYHIMFSHLLFREGHWEGQWENIGNREEEGQRRGEGGALQGMRRGTVRSKTTRRRRERRKGKRSQVVAKREGQVAANIMQWQERKRRGDEGNKKRRRRITRRMEVRRQEKRWG